MPQSKDPMESYEHLESDSKTDLGLDQISSGSSSSSSDSSTTDQEKEAEDGLDPVTQPRRWDPDVTMYKNKKSLIVHVAAVGGAHSFSCGIRISDDFEEIHETAFLDVRKCKRCEAARPIKTVGQFASALKKLRTER